MNRLTVFLILFIVILTGACISDTGKQSEIIGASEKEKPSALQDTSDALRPPIYYTPFDQRYDGGGFFALVDGKTGGMDYAKGFWQGYNERDLDVAIDLGREKHVTSVTARFLKIHGGWIFLPGNLTIQVSSDLKEFVTVGELNPEIPDSIEEDSIETLTIDGLDVIARYVRIRANSIGPVPEYVENAKGRPAWFFIDEVIIE